MFSLLKLHNLGGFIQVVKILELPCDDSFLAPNWKTASSRTAQ